MPDPADLKDYQAYCIIDGTGSPHDYILFYPVGLTAEDIFSYLEDKCKADLRVRMLLFGGFRVQIISGLILQGTEADRIRLSKKLSSRKPAPELLL